MSDSKPEVLVVDWKTTFFDDLEDNSYYALWYKPLKEHFDLHLYFGRAWVPEDVIGKGFAAVVYHSDPMGTDDIDWLRKFPDSRKYILSTTIHKSRTFKEIKDMKFIFYDKLEASLKEDLLMKRWEDFLAEIEEESDPDILRERYGMQDNFVFLLTVDDSLKLEVEGMLEEYPKEDDFDRVYEKFGSKGYIIENTIVRYSPDRSPAYVEWFEHKSGQQSDSNASLSFHPHGNGYVEQILSGKQAVIAISGKLMALRIPFESARPASRYVP